MKNINLAFLPGWGVSSKIFYIFADKLHAKVKNKGINLNITFIDLPNIYNTNLEREFLSLDHDSRLSFVANIIDKQISKDSVLIGWSLGGLFAIDLCSRFYDKYRNLVLLSSCPRFVENDNEIGISKKTIVEFFNLIETNPDKLFNKFASLLSYPVRNADIKTNIKENLITNILESKLPDTTNSLSLEDLTLYLELLAYTDRTIAYKKVAPITTEIFGDKDGVIPYAAYMQLSKVVTKQSYELEGAGHSLFLSHQDKVLDIIEKQLMR